MHDASTELDSNTDTSTEISRVRRFIAWQMPWKRLFSW